MEVGAVFFCAFLHFSPSHLQHVREVVLRHDVVQLVVQRLEGVVVARPDGEGVELGEGADGVVHRVEHVRGQRVRYVVL